MSFTNGGFRSFNAYPPLQPEKSSNTKWRKEGYNGTVIRQESVRETISVSLGEYSIGHQLREDDTDMEQAVNEATITHNTKRLDVLELEWLQTHTILITIDAFRPLCHTFFCYKP